MVSCAKRKIGNTQAISVETCLALSAYHIRYGITNRGAVLKTTAVL